MEMKYNIENDKCIQWVRNEIKKHLYTESPVKCLLQYSVRLEPKDGIEISNELLIEQAEMHKIIRKDLAKKLETYKLTSTDELIFKHSPESNLFLISHDKHSCVWKDIVVDNFIKFQEKYWNSIEISKFKVSLNYILSDPLYVAIFCDSKRSRESDDVDKKEDSNSPPVKKVKKDEKEVIKIEID